MLEKLVSKWSPPSAYIGEKAKFIVDWPVSFPKDEACGKPLYFLVTLAVWVKFTG